MFSVGALLQIDTGFKFEEEAPWDVGAAGEMGGCNKQSAMKTVGVFAQLGF